MARLEELTRGASVKGVLSNTLVTVVDVKWPGSSVDELVYKDSGGRLGDKAKQAAGEFWFSQRHPVDEFMERSTLCG
jgi:hypothetical protein